MNTKLFYLSHPTPIATIDGDWPAIQDMAARVWGCHPDDVSTRDDILDASGEYVEWLAVRGEIVGSMGRVARLRAADFAQAA